MAYLETMYLVVGDTLPNTVFTVIDQTTGLAVNLTGATVRMRIREVGATTEKAALVCSAVDLINGQVSTAFPAGVLDTAGTFEAEIEVTFPGGVQTMYDKIKLVVRGAVG
jgi:hypothetical protein